MKRIKLTILVLFVVIISNAQTTIFTNDMDYVIGDVKQAFIQNKISTYTQVDNLILGMKNLGVNGIRIPIFAEGLTPNKMMFDYFHQQAVIAGFPIFANPAQSSGGQRIACGILNETICEVKGDASKTTILIDRVISFANEYACAWIDPFNEDGAPDGAWSTDQMNTIFSSLKNKLNGAELIGPCVWGIPASIKVLEKTTIANDITIAATHNLGFNHEDWAEFIALAKESNLPVWDSEVNHNDLYKTGSRLEVAIAAGIDGLVLYNIWNTVNLNNGAISNSGKKMMAIYLKNLPKLTPNFQVEQEAWIESSTALVSVGQELKLAPFPVDGTWTWSGPNGFKATTREITFSTISVSTIGKYIASYTSPAGDKNSLTMTVGILCENSTVIQPYQRIDGTSWTRSFLVEIEEGSTLELGPQASGSRSWFWTGPNAFESNSREITFNTMHKELEGDYRVTTISSNDGCVITNVYTVRVNDILFPFPDPDARYYIDCPALNLRLGANGSQDAFTTTMANTDYDVQWTVQESTTAGYYYIDCIGAGFAAPRIRTDRTPLADMDSRKSTGNYAKWSLAKGENDTYLLRTQDSFLPRLRINASGQATMVAVDVQDFNTAFTFTDVKKGLVGSLPSLDVDNIKDSSLELVFPGVLDRNNSFFKPVNTLQGITDYSLDIYTIYGQKLFSSNAIDKSWNANTHKNGMYIYRVNYKTSNGNSILKSGKFYHIIH